MILFAEDEAPVTPPRESAVPGLLQLARLALALGRTNRITRHECGQRFETVAEHTVMLAWCSLALNEAMDLGLDPGEIARFALCHDAPEAICGDTQTLRVTPELLAAKAEREEAAIQEIEGASAGLPWLGWSIRKYEMLKGGESKAAAFVHAVDKMMPKLTNVLNRGATLAESGIGREELAALLDRQRGVIAGTLPARVTEPLIALQRALSGLTLELLRSDDV